MSTTASTQVSDPPRRLLTPLSRSTTSAIVVLLAGFVALAVLVSAHWVPLMSFDQAVVAAAHRDVLADPGLLSAAKLVTALGDDLAVNLIAVVVGLLLLWRRRVRAAVYLAAVRVVQLGVAETSKLVIARPRPNLPNPVAHSSSFSFPSGHASGTTVAFGVLLLLVLATTGHPAPSGRRAWGWPFGAFVIVWVAAVATSRVLLGVHYPSDVAAGVLLGAACCLAGRVILRPSEPAVAAVLTANHSGATTS